MKEAKGFVKELEEVFDDLKAEKIKPSVAAELNNAAGKIIAFLKLKLEYHAIRKEKPTITYLKDDIG